MILFENSSEMIATLDMDRASSFMPIRRGDSPSASTGMPQLENESFADVFGPSCR